MNRIITIGREFGSGGREFGRRLSEELGFAYYDQKSSAKLPGERRCLNSMCGPSKNICRMFSFPIISAEVFIFGQSHL